MKSFATASLGMSGWEGRWKIMGALSDWSSLISPSADLYPLRNVGIMMLLVDWLGGWFDLQQAWYRT